MKELNFLFNKLPFYIIFYPTSRCNARCPHCFNYERQDSAAIKDELSLDEIDKISKNFGHVKVLTITGGEPFLRDDLPGIVEIFKKNNGLQYVSLHTNAFMVDKVTSTVLEILKKFEDIKVIVCISIDDIGEAHDNFRGVKDGFDKLLKTIANLKELQARYKNLHLVSSTIFSNTTMNSFKNTIRFIQEDIGGIKPSLSFIRGSVLDESEKSIDYTKYQEFYKEFRYKVSENIHPLSPMAFKEALETLTNEIVINNYRLNKQSVRCQAGRKLVVIYENGDTYPCEICGKKFGNLRDVNYDIKELLFSDNGKHIIREINQEKICSCTWENIISVNLLYSPAYYPKIFLKWFRLFVLKKQ